MNNQQSFEEFANPVNYQFEKISCYLCGSEDEEFLLKGQEDLTGKEGEFRYVTCKNCGFVYQNPRIGIDQIGEFYDREYIAHRKKKDWGVLTPLYERAMSKHDRDKDKLISQYLKLDPGSRVLDVGCAVGTFLLHLKNKYKCFVSGVDFKEDLSYPGFEDIDFHQGLFYKQDNLIPDSYDLVTMWHFLEHCYDPIESLKKAKEVVSSNGLVVVEVPRLDSVSYKLFGERWPGVQAPQHTVMFDKKSLLSMVKKAGLEVVDYLPYGAFHAYFYLFAGTYFKTFGKGLDLDKIVAPYFLGQAMLSPVLAFEKKLNLAMQTVVLKKS